MLSCVGASLSTMAIIWGVTSRLHICLLQVLAVSVMNRYLHVYRFVSYSLNTVLLLSSLKLRCNKQIANLLVTGLCYVEAISIEEMKNYVQNHAKNKEIWWKLGPKQWTKHEKLLRPRSKTKKTMNIIKHYFKSSEKERKTQFFEDWKNSGNPWKNLRKNNEDCVLKNDSCLFSLDQWSKKNYTLRPETLEIFTVSKVSGRNLQGFGTKITLH